MSSYETSARVVCVYDYVDLVFAKRKNRASDVLIYKEDFKLRIL